ncbi:MULTISPECIES: site-specific DNA-methyltransferase [Gardnerella]|uniref:site-specific DNA-methyltransferase n=1 Tax=Gardnerella TaxID=2701 RepID=UPI0003545DB2|nr:site-specific DNA-methyltransferase [Gardnerella piotii]EPI44353.1 DNA (cytosine-5-)-methyltransferase [Gardnerella vaginalis JCP8522]MDK6472180.1 site-specific DNA-methyltransferase [Bifidobacterium sp. UMB9259]RFT23196.1 site-specific DNA-methyltransferase [Bifidobacteriaceae bacterium GH022]RIY22151.1 site-specific DNA-methyltransferase [Bifidobacteriaceae bacterium VN002]UQA80916.1 site-specific DNA-methyltransferase [Gardnerella piotii]
MSTNISKQKRDDLIAKIGQIRTFISAAPQDENTGNLLTYLSELEKDVNGKKYGLVFEEHREEIDDVLDTHTPVLTEDKSLFIDNGGQMNFLIEGDNLASLKLLEKTHKGKIDLIYIDPPYNTGNQDFIYDDTYLSATDGYQHSKWISFITERLKIAKKFLAQNGVIAISIGYQEVHNLMLMCQEMFYEKNVTCVTVQTSGGKPNGGFNITYEFIVFITPNDFSPNASESAMNEYASPYHGMNLATFDQVQRPGQAYPIFVDKDGVFLGCGKSLAERVKAGEYNGELQDFIYDYSEAPEGAYAIWPVTRKGVPCVWRLIPSRLAKDWEKGYIKIVPQNPGKTKNLFTVQYLSDGVIKKIKSGELETHRLSEDSRIPTVNVDNYRTAGTTIQSIWTEKAFYTTNGGNEMADILGSKKAFSYPKPLALVSEVVQRISKENSTILDFFAGSGTTGHAVMKLNDEDGGNRRFILCTNNENNICRDVTYERIKRVIDKEGYAASLKYYKVDYIPISERLYYEYAGELLCHIRELVELENGINFVGNAEIAIVLTEEELAVFMANIDAYSKCRKLYMGHDLLPDEEQEKSLVEHDIEINIIPDYYYRELQEV